MKRAKLPWPWPAGWAIYGNGLGSRVACFLAALKGFEMFNCGLILEHLGIFYVSFFFFTGGGEECDCLKRHQADVFIFTQGRNPLYRGSFPFLKTNSKPVVYVKHVSLF